ncbi:AP-4 complex accessory subunit tepsin [Liparis tanakae]|uniref:AP-4 complex accessory subunit tepsin n=1 Tax=Liparis tanakae TaxID=230148 RepID=A0A4Z2I9G5_9TELE|nr:AP-4 complex accessory subunit tepsin [Liparis tanakae]
MKTLQVLKIFVHLCGHGSNHFLTELRRNSTFIQQASVYSGPPDPIHGTALYQKVRNTAQDVARLLFTDIVYTKDGVSPPLNLALPTMGMGSATSRRSGMQGFGYSPGKQGTAGSDSLLDKIQKAAEVVVSAVLPPIEHQGIRLHDNHYRAVAAPSTAIEVAVPACAYNLPARTPTASIQRCPGQVGGGWEETDSGNSSSHNSSQDIAANSRASVGSKSAGTGSQSGASRESSGDLSERVEAMQLGDCGQEVALISRLTEGSRVFLSREESQHFIKECSILNCEVVVELLSSRLQDPSNTVKMILRQFEALMGGTVLAPRQDAASSSRPATTPQITTSTHSDPLLPEPSAGSPTLNHYRPDVSPAGVPQPQTPPSSPSSLSSAQRDLSGELANQSEPVGTAEVRLVAEESEPRTNGSSSHRAEPRRLGRRSLFSGMELVATARPLCTRGTSPTETDAAGGRSTETLAARNGIDVGDARDEPPYRSNAVASDSSRPVSAFTFLNF